MANSTRQVAALPWRAGRICLVTSVNRRRWVIPKGHIDEGMKPRDMAAVEAWEEAGLRGEMSAEPIGSYHYEKLNRDYHVSVYLLYVDVVEKDWPEAQVRRREWFSPEEAVARIDEVELQRLVQLTAARLLL